MTSTPSVLILGARGRFGRAAANAFAHAGWQVHGQLRPGGDAPAIAGVQWLHCVPEDTAALAAASGSSVVVQALSPPYTHKAWRDGVPRLTQSAIDVTRALGATLMLPASVYNFGAGMPALLQEDTPQQPTTIKGRLRMASEAAIRQATQDGGMKAVVIRGGDFFGSGTGSWLDLVLAKDLRSGKFTYPAAPQIPTAWAYLPDMARSFVKVAQARDQLGAFETLHFGGYSLTVQDWQDALQEIAWEQGWLPAGGQLRTARLSWPLMQLVGLAVPEVRALCEMRYLWRTPHALVNNRMAQLTGAEPQTPLLQAVRQSLHELGMLGASPRTAAAIPSLAT